ncbi:MAG: Fis family transcriptional regulator, partial [Planctomycetia bacterium]|nr:Fis family transcriptional regulator [Planctomycetia bacterium]
RDGTELVRALKADDPSAPVLLMSGHHAAYVRRHAGDLAGQVLEKPFTLASLSEHLQRVVERARR